MTASLESVFPTFFMSGFECSTVDWHGVGRRDLTAETRHRDHAAEDYGMLADLGIAVAREGVPWPVVDTGSGYDFSLNGEWLHDGIADVQPDGDDLSYAAPGGCR